MSLTSYTEDFISIFHCDHIGLLGLSISSAEA